MNIFTGLLIFTGILCAIGISECLECFNCLNIADPRACSNMSQCSNRESCYLKTLHSGNEVRYDMGCQVNQLCRSDNVDPNGIIGRSIQTRQQYSCHECCSSTGCNDQLCSHRKPTSCIDDVNLDCARLNSLFHVCADVHHAKITCPKFCGLCQLVDGSWADWGAWSACTVTCNSGTQERSRKCSNPAPSNNGLNCTGPGVESKICQNQLCPVHGNWSDWSIWSNCSATCGVGVRQKIRTCTNPKPDRSGNDCVGEYIEYTVCPNKPCSVIDGGWASWGSWERCSVTCGVGQKLRSRTCTNPSPTLYGKTCEGDYTDYAVCVNTPCHVVAFNAHGFHELSNNVNAFPTVIFNEGNAYNASTGHFTAPVDGIFYFTTQMCCQGNSGFSFFLEKVSENMSAMTRLTATMQTENGYPACTSASSSVKLTRNEHVWVKMDGQLTTGQLYENSTLTWISFTGMLTQEL
ncbi:thrombospondin-2-like [Dreissena polymorpha]|uniref:C1q domain-containing protein n=1 Tax=Dreissena polymorpha TaxID=45954 RepID=A0A9D4DSF9_DREPO|nr:thrombospondin-2-like [Dreissena polymorpha]KAH3754724.1 hypothetical protein DPMN_189405 [Dreissena polymorpha]